MTVPLFDAKQDTVQLTTDKLVLHALAGPDEKPYAVELRFHAPVNPEVSLSLEYSRSS